MIQFFTQNSEALALIFLGLLAISETLPFMKKFEGNGIIEQLKLAAKNLAKKKAGIKEPGSPE
jgi:hypothetical protein